MVAAYVAALEKAYSIPRFQSYRPSGGSDLDMIVTYLWNVAISEALYPTFAALEVAMRNTIYDTLANYFSDPLWFYRPGLLEPEQLRQFSQARLTLFRRHGNTPSPGLIVAELSFAFWTTLLSRNYHGSIWNVGHGTNLRTAFPYVPTSSLVRDKIHARYNHLRFTRNRLMHHEPVWRGIQFDKHHHGISAIHHMAIEAVAWISPQARAGIDLVDRFPSVYTNGRAQIEAGIKTHLGIP